MDSYFINSINRNTKLRDQLIQILCYCRSKTIYSVNKLNVLQLDFTFDDKSNSIGTLLRHIAALEDYYQKIIFHNRYLNDLEREYWAGALPKQLIWRKTSGNDVNYYLELLSRVRSETMTMLSRKRDSWLFKGPIFREAPPFNNYFCLFHLVEEELAHLGQINLIKSRFTLNTEL